MNIKTTLFIDLDGTIMENPFHTAVFPYLTDHLVPQLGITAAELRQAFFTENKDRLRQWEAYGAVKSMDWDDIVETVVRRYGLDVPRRVCDLVVEHSRAPYIRALDDAPTVLRELAQPGHRRLVVSSMGLSRYQMPVLEALGMAELFHDFLMPDLTGYLKTDLRFFSRYTAQDAPGLFISVGDNYSHDVIHPKQFGFRSVYKANSMPELAAYSPFERPSHLPESEALPDAVILSMTELPAVVEALEARFL